VWKVERAVTDNSHLNEREDSGPPGRDRPDVTATNLQAAEPAGSGRSRPPSEAEKVTAEVDSELEALEAALTEEDLQDVYDSFQGSAQPIEENAEPAAGPEQERDVHALRWYILKVQSNRENSICDALQRRVAVAGMEHFFGEIIVPTEDVAEYKNGKRRVVKRKLYPGYIVVNMDLNDESWMLVRETPGIGDFAGAAGKPTPMLPEEVERIVRAAHPEEAGSEQIKTAIPFKLGDRVRIKEGTFENFDGDVEGLDEANGRVTVMINIFGRSTPVELEHWQVEPV
jgi:transcriptional antiterminator NusG